MSVQSALARGGGRWKARRFVSEPKQGLRSSLGRHSSSLSLFFSDRVSSQESIKAAHLSAERRKTRRLRCRVHLFVPLLTVVELLILAVLKSRETTYGLDVVEKFASPLEDL